MTIQLEPNDALLVVDMQNDFLSGGSLAVPDSDSIIPVVNNYIQRFTKANLPVFASRDYHPVDHISFVDQGGIWPPHCVTGTSGAEFHPDLEFPAETKIISKACSKEKDAYSALDSTELDSLLKKHGITRLFICGLATDYCVHASGMDLLKAGYKVLVLTDAVKAVEVNKGDGDKALDELYTNGATALSLTDLSS